MSSFGTEDGITSDGFKNLVVGDKKYYESEKWKIPLAVTNGTHFAFLDYSSLSVNPSVSWHIDGSRYVSKFGDVVGLMSKNTNHPWRLLFLTNQ